SQRYTFVEFFTGVGDSTDVFVEVGYNFRVNDSVRSNRLQKVNTSNTYYFKSRLLNTERTQLSVFVNYRELKYADIEITNKYGLTPYDPIIRREPENSLNSRILYNQSFLDGGILWNTAME